MLCQIFFSPQVKLSVIISNKHGISIIVSNKHGIYELRHK